MQFTGQTQLLIDGAWGPASDGGTFDTLDPATGEVLARVAHATAGDVARAVRAARRALEQGHWARMDAVDRGKLRFALADLIEKNAESLAQLETLNSGKTIRDSRGDMADAASCLRYYAGWADKIEGRTIPMRWINCYHVVQATTPFGGFKMSARDGRTARRRWSTTPRARR